VGTVEHGEECGIVLENMEEELMMGDIIENYKESIKKDIKFSKKNGLFHSY
jgi:hypothetical protein